MGVALGPVRDERSLPQRFMYAVMARVKESQAKAKVSRALSNVPERWKHWNGFDEFCRSDLKIVNKEKQLVRFVPNPLQRQLIAQEIWLRRQKKRVWMIVLKHRKVGVSTLEQALAFWQLWRTPHQEAMTLAHKPAETAMLFRVVTRLWENQPEEHRHEKTNAAISKMEFKKWDAIYLAATAGAGTARGGTLSRMHGSECAFWPSLSETHTGLAESIGPTSAYVLESTPNGREGKGQDFYEFWQDAKAGKNNFVPVFLPWFADKSNKIELLEPDEIDDVLKADDEARLIFESNHLTKAQMKWWLDKRRSIVATGRNRDKIHQEEPSDDEKCFVMSSLSYYDAELLQTAEDRCQPPLAVEENGRLHIWDVPDPDEPADYIIGSDPSEGVGGDNCCAVGFNMRTGRQAFTWTDNRTSPGMFGSVVLPRLGLRWANPSSGTPAFHIVERNNHGHATLTGLLFMAKYPKDRVYHAIDEARVDESGDPKEGSGRAGWSHGADGHADLTEAVARLLRDGRPRILDKRVITSMRNVTSGPNGAEFGGKDEAVSAGVCVIGWPHAAAPSPFMYIGGRIVRVDGQPIVPVVPQ